MRLHEVIKLLEDKEINELDTIKTLTDDMVYENGALYYVTDKGYRSEQVSINLETLTNEYEIEKNAPKKFDVFEAIKRVDEGKKVTAPFYTNETLSSVEELIRFIQINEIKPMITSIEFEEVDDTQVVNHNGQKLTEQDVRDIFIKRIGLAVPVKELAVEYGVTERMVYYILDGTYWSSVRRDYQENPEHFMLNRLGGAVPKEGFK